jgi:hypothetical protein
MIQSPADEVRRAERFLGLEPGLFLIKFAINLLFFSCDVQRLRNRSY